MFIVAVANQKGGTMKTTSTVSMSAALARAGKKVTMVDLDPQSSLTEYFMEPADLVQTMHDALVKDVQIAPLILAPLISLLPTNIDLAAAELLLPTKPNFERKLARVLRPLDADYIIIDCPPSLGVLTRNALTASNIVLIPVSTEKMAVRTVPLILDQIDEVRESELNVHLRAWYILATLYDSRETEATKSLQELRASYNSLVYPTPVARRTNYKKAVREHVDVGDLDTEQGVFWDTLAAQLIAESEKEHSHA